MRPQLTAACERIIRAAQARGEDEGQVGMLLSGGVDTGAILAALGDNKHVKAAITVVVGEEAHHRDKIQRRQEKGDDVGPPDPPFAKCLATQFGIERHYVEHVTAKQLLEEPLDVVVKTCNSFDPMHVRNSLVIAYALSRAKALEPTIKTWLTGDAADELFGGYSFTWNEQDPDIWKQKRDKMARGATYASEALGLYFNLTVVSPFRDRVFEDWALEFATRQQCIGIRRIRTRFEDELSEEGDVMTGKVLLRDAFPEVLSSHRRKDPIEVGSGSRMLTTFIRDKYMMDSSNNKNNKSAGDQYGIRLRNEDYEQWCYFEAFERLVLTKPISTGLGDWSVKNAGGVESNPTCMACGSKDLSDRFCRTCGEWPAIEVQASV